MRAVNALNLSAFLLVEPSGTPARYTLDNQRSGRQGLPVLRGCETKLTRSA